MCPARPADSADFASVTAACDQGPSGRWQVPPSGIRTDCLSPGAMPGIIVLPRYTRGIRTRLAPVSPGETLLVLGAGPIGFDHHGALPAGVLQQHGGR